MKILAKQKISLFLPVLLALSALTAEARAQESATIQLFRRSFLPLVATIEAGGEIHFVWQAGEHFIRSGLSSRPEDDPGALFEGVVDEANPVLTVRFDTPGDYAFFDDLNEQTGGVGTITVLGSAICSQIATF